MRLAAVSPADRTGVTEFIGISRKMRGFPAIRAQNGPVAEISGLSGERKATIMKAPRLHGP
ncbi:hypothetical protein GCM10027018_04030 [Paenibacillus thermoaerophilus]